MGANHSHTGGPIRLVTRADDAGGSVAKNEAILETFEDGILRNVSIMPPAPAFDHAVDTLGHHDDLCVGLHVTLCSVTPGLGPVLPADEVPTLVNADGDFPPTPGALAERGADPEEMLDETRAQLRQLRNHGVAVGYVDTHMESNAYRGVRGFGEMLSEFATDEGLIEGQTTVPRLPAGSPSELIAALDGIDAGAHLVVGHPGYSDDEGTRERLDDWRIDESGDYVAGVDPLEWLDVMDRERRMFTDPDVIEYVESRGIEPIRYVDS